MAENEGNGQGTTTEQPNAAPEAAREKDDTVSIRKGELAGYKTQLREMKKQLEEFTAMRSAEEQEKLKAAQNWEALEKKKTAEIEAMRAELTASKRAVLTERARTALLGAGMSAGLAVDGALSTLPSDIEADAIAAWVDSLKQSHPTEFAKPSNPIGAPSAGPTGKPTTDEAGTLKSKWLNATSRPGKVSPAALAAIKAEIDAWASSHPGQKHPLA